MRNLVLETKIYYNEDFDFWDAKNEVFLYNEKELRIIAKVFKTEDGFEVELNQEIENDPEGKFKALIESDAIGKYLRTIS